jgi:hypothetical protein
LLFKYKQVSKINSLETYNAVLIDLNSEQQNITHFTILGQKQSFLLQFFHQTYVKILIGERCFVKKIVFSRLNYFNSTHEKKSYYFLFFQ